MKTLATLAMFACFAAAPALADDDKHRNYYPGFSYGSIVSSCNHRANQLRLRGHERRDFVDHCTRHSNQYTGRDWDRVRYDRYQSRYCNDNDRRYRDYVRYRDDDRYRDDWRYAVLEDFIRLSAGRN
jgi:hypothetical protein